MRAAAWVVASLMAVAAGCDGRADGGSDGGGALDGAAVRLDAVPDAAPDVAPSGDLGALDRGPERLDAALDGSAADRGGDAAAPDAAFDGAADAAPDAEADAQPAVEADVVAYCDCMLLTCHDLYHRLWGEDEGVARARCFRVATDLPRAPEATEGDSLECRAHWCDASFDLDDPALCPRAGGDEVCR